MWAVCKRELQMYFFSPVGYVFIAIYMIISAIIFFNVNFSSTLGTEANFASTMQNMIIYMSFITPILTMRSFAEERKNKTDQLLLTSPLHISAIVMGKFFATLAVLLVAMALNLIFPLVLAIYTTTGALDGMMIFTEYVGFFLISATFMAIGIFVSSLTESQVVAAVVSFAIAFFLWLGNSLLTTISLSWVQTLSSSLNIISRYSDFAEGYLGLAPFIYYISVSGLFLFLTVRSIERRRWTGV